MHEDDRQLLERVIVTAEDCRRVVDVLARTPPDSAMFVARLRQLSDALFALVAAISRRLSSVDVDAVEKTTRDVFAELTEPPELPSPPTRTCSTASGPRRTHSPSTRRVSFRRTRLRTSSPSSWPWPSAR